MRCLAAFPASESWPAEGLSALAAQLACPAALAATLSCGIQGDQGGLPAALVGMRQRASALVAVLDEMIDAASGAVVLSDCPLPTPLPVC